MDRNIFIQGLRDLADFLEANPELPCPTYGTFNTYGPDKETMALFAKLAAPVSKHVTPSGETFWLRRNFGPIELDMNCARETVCERVKTGTRTIPAQPETVLPATQEKEEEIYEWRCSPILGEVA